MAFKRRNSRPVSKDFTLYFEHCKAVAELLQKEVESFGMTVTALRVDPPAGIMPRLEKQQRQLLAVASAAASGKKKKTKRIPIQGQANEQQIIAFGEVLRHFTHATADEFLEFHSTHMALNAPTMSGKTGLINVCSFLAPVLHLLTGEDFLIKRLLINSNTLESQSDIALSSFMRLYGRTIQFEFDGLSMTLEKYIQELNDRVSILRQEGLESANFRASPQKALAFEQLKNAVQAEDNLHMIACCDEAHYRTEKNSILHQMIRGEQDWIGEKICYVAFSATNYAFSQFAEENGYPIVTMPPADGYVGYGWVGSKRYDMIVPELASLEEFDEMSGAGLCDVKDVGNLALAKHKKKHTDPVRALRAYEDFVNRWKWAVYRAAKYCLITSNKTGSKGMVVRGLIDNNAMSPIVASLNRMFGKDIVFILYNSDTKKDMVCAPDENPLEAMVTREAGPPENRRPYVLVGTGEFRLGNDLGRDCLVGLEFGDMEPQVLMQSIPGRMTGYKDRTFVILCDSNIRMLRNYILTGKWQKEGKRGNVKVISPYKRHVVVNHVKRYEMIPSSALPASLRNELNKFVREHAAVKPGTNKTNYNIVRKESGGIFPVELFDQLVAALPSTAEKVLPAKHLRQTDGRLHVAIRSKHSLNLTNMGGGKVGGNTNLGEGRFEPALFVDENLNIAHCKLFLAVPVESQSITKRPFYSHAG